MDKNGQFNFDTVKAVIVALLIIAVLGIAGMMALSTLKTSVAVTTTGKITNETVTLLNSTNGGTLVSVSAYEGVTYSGITLLNSTSDVLVASGNYTTANGLFLATSTATYNNQEVKISATYTYIDREGTNEIANNYTVGIARFFQQTPTFFVLLAVVILISIIVLVIVVVSRYQGGGSNASL